MDLTTKKRDRLYELDMLKFFSVAAMILSHAVSRLGRFNAGYESDIRYFFGNVILQDYAGVAHAFMFAMGVGMIYCRDQSPEHQMKRGVKIYFMGYILNFCRYGIYDLADCLIEAKISATLVYSLFEQDIFHFAGLAMIVTGLLKKLRFGEKHILLTAVLLSAVGSLLPFVDTGFFPADLLLGHFIFTTEGTSYFVFLNWYIFVAAGLCFGRLMKKTEEPERIYRPLLVISACTSALYLLLTLVFGCFFMTREGNYCALSLPEAGGLLSLYLFLLSLFYYLSGKTGKRIMALCLEVSRCLSSVYFIQWCIIGFVESVFCVLLGLSFSYPLIYLTGVGVMVLSVCGASCLRKKKEEKSRRAKD